MNARVLVLSIVGAVLFTLLMIVLVVHSHAGSIEQRRIFGECVVQHPPLECRAAVWGESGI